MDVEKLLTHMAWSNREIFAEVSKLPDSALDSFADDTQWTVREIISHICESATWYAWCLRKEGDDFDWQDHMARSKIKPSSSSDIHALIEVQAVTDSHLLSSKSAPDELLTIDLAGNPFTCARSTILTQAIHHATEHRTQLVAALVAGKFTNINLDNYHLWGFKEVQK
jgi:uncharacterized damage-inducible protein DinB